MIAPSTKLKHRWNPNHILTTYKLAQEGKSNLEIARALGVPLDLFEGWVVVKATMQRALEEGRDLSLDRRMATLGITDNQVRYLAAYARTGSHYGAHAATGMARSTHYDWLEEAPNKEEYAKAFQYAKLDYAERLKHSAVKQATGHYRRYKFNKDGSPIYIECEADHPDAKEFEDREGNPVYMRHYYEKSFSPALLARLLQAALPEEFAERRETKVEHTGDISLIISELVEGPKIVDGRVVDGTIQRMIEDGSHG